MGEVVLHTYFRSSTSFRARIALNLKGVSYRSEFHHLRLGKHRDPAYLAVNPQGLVPTLVWSDGMVLSQSLAIIEFLDEVIAEPALLPRDPAGRARVRALSQMIACDIHPVNNLRILNALRSRFGADDAAVADWFRTWVAETFGPLEHHLTNDPQTGRFCHGDTPTMADICLVAQVANNGRFGVDMEPYPVIRRIHTAAMELPAFIAAAPQNQPDAE